MWSEFQCVTLREEVVYLYVYIYMCVCVEVGWNERVHLLPRVNVWVRP